ncbi:MAG: hypothetical protein R3247_13715 [Rhodothermales bacterium]|nr:hypothetical protein [Rhodothermales bacterium]
MARIPVEKKSGAAWWPWLLALVLLALGGWLLLEALDDEPETVATSTTLYEDDMNTAGDADYERAAPGVTAGESASGTAGMEAPITSLTTLLGADDPQALEGRRVRLSGVTASAVSGDSTYWVYNPDEDVERRVFAVLYRLGESDAGPGTGADGRYNVDEGETMQIEGVIQTVEPSDPDAWGVTGEVERELRAEQIYIRARTLDNLGT